MCSYKLRWSILLQMFSQIHINLAIWQLLKWKQISNHVVALSRFLYDNFNIRILFSSFWFKLQSIVGCSWIILIQKQLQNCAKLTGKGLQWSPIFSKVAVFGHFSSFFIDFVQMVGFVYYRISSVFGLIEPTISENTCREQSSFLGK